MNAPRLTTPARRSALLGIATLGCLPTLASAFKLQDIGNALKGNNNNAQPVANGNMTGENDTLVRGYNAANKDVLLANSIMAEALGLKDAAAASKATAEALTDGSTKGNLEDANKAVSSSTQAVSAELAKGPQLDDAAKVKFGKGAEKLAHGVQKYVALQGPVAQFSTGLKNAPLTMLPRLQAGVYVMTQLPGGLSTAVRSLKQVVAFSKSNNIPVPSDATKAMESL